MDAFRRWIERRRSRKFREMLQLARAARAASMAHLEQTMIFAAGPYGIAHLKGRYWIFTRRWYGWALAHGHGYVMSRSAFDHVRSLTCRT